MGLDGKTAFITGGAIGFGRAFAHALGSRGVDIAIVDIDGPAATATSSELVEAGFRSIAVTCDVVDEEGVNAAVAETIARLGGVDILVNNAACHLSRFSRPFREQPRADVRRLLDVNVMGVVNCSLACRPSMSDRGGGTIVNIASTAGFGVNSPYGVSKLAVRGLTIAFARELAEDGIRVNAIAPGLMATENALDDLPQDKIDHFVAELQLVHRLGTMDDVVATLLFLCSDEASFITGETIRVSGGYPLAL